MDEGLKLQAQEWFDRGTHDIETAQLLYAQGGYADIIAYHIQQAIEKYLKGFLIFNGERPPRIHDLIAYHARQCAEEYLKAFLVYHQIDFPYTHNIGRLPELCAEKGEWARDLSEGD